MPFSCIIESDLVGVLQMVEIAANDPAAAIEEAKRVLKEHRECLAAHLFVDGEPVVVIGPAEISS